MTKRQIKVRPSDKVVEAIKQIVKVSPSDAEVVNGTLMLDKLRETIK